MPPRKQAEHSFGSFSDIVPQFQSLPRADQFGHYWFDEPPKCPAIFKTSGFDRDGRSIKGRYMVCVAEGEVLFTADGELLTFGTPLEALDSLNDALRRRHSAQCAAGKRQAP